MLVISYNVHRWVGRDGRCWPGRIASLLEPWQPDLIGLQEADGRSLLAGPGGVQPTLAELGGRDRPYQALVAPTLGEPGGFYGNVLLVRWPVLGRAHVDLSVPGREPRNALLVRLALAEGRTLAVAVTHLGLRRGERTRQTARLLVALARFAPDPGEPLLLLGDLNDWGPSSRILPLLERALGPTGANQRPRTFPAVRPVFALDRIWLRRPGRLREVWALGSPAARVASDHLPLLARFEPHGFASTGERRRRSYV